MRDQPFKRYFPSQKKIPKNSYKYPTYQHYYQSKAYPINAPSNNKHQQQTNQSQDPFLTPTKKGIHSLQAEIKKESKPNLKTQLQHLKNQVYRIMEKKQGILRSPIVDKKTLAQKQIEISSGAIEDLDNQSVSSDKIFGQTMRKVELKRSSQNYDYSKYMQLQNNLLKTELRNLKNKYISKKKELMEKCEALEQKNQFLQNALFKSEQSLAQEINALKANLKQAQSNERQQIIPTSDKDQDSNKLQQLYDIINRLQKQKEQLQKRPNYNNTLQEISTNIRTQYEQKINALLNQKNSLLSQIQEKVRGIRLLQNKNEDLLSQIEILNTKIESQIQRQAQVEQDYHKTLQVAQRNHAQLIEALHKQFNNKLISLTPKKQTYRSQQSMKMQGNEADVLRKEIKKWKIEYKILKERYESYLKVESESQSEIKDYYKGYHEFKQKNSILQSKNQLLESEYSKCIDIISGKDCSIIEKQLQLKNVKNELQEKMQESKKQNAAIVERCRLLEQRLQQQTQRIEKDAIYRQELQQKFLSSQAGDEKLKEGLERIKKRVAEQDEKLSKNVKELKNKQSLISKLKVELREVMENAGKKAEEKMKEEAKQIIQTYKSDEQDAIKCIKKQFQKQKALTQQAQSKLIDQIQGLKLQNHQLKMKMVNLQNQLKLLFHTYNTKTLDLSSQLTNREEQIQSLHEHLKEKDLISQSTHTSLKEQINMKNEQIMYLRKEVVSKYTITNSMNISGTFDEVLRSQIEGNNKLKEESLRKVEEIYKMRDNYSSLRSQYQNLKSEYDISKLKFMSQKKNIEVAYQAEIQNYKNAVDSWEKKIISLEQKIKIFIEENKKKDQFIQQFIIGKRITDNQKEVLADFMKHYQAYMGNSNIIDRLMVETKTIENLQKYNESLIKEVAQLKQRLTLFETTDERGSLYQSMHSPHSKKSIEQRIEQIENDCAIKKAISVQELPNCQNKV